MNYCSQLRACADSVSFILDCTSESSLLFVLYDAFRVRGHGSFKVSRRFISEGRTRAAIAHLSAVQTSRIKCWNLTWVSFHICPSSYECGERIRFSAADRLPSSFVFKIHVVRPKNKASKPRRLYFPRQRHPCDTHVSLASRRQRRIFSRAQRSEKESPLRAKLTCLRKCLFVPSAPEAVVLNQCFLTTSG